MAIPENFIDKFTDVDSGERRYICPAADKVRVDNDNFEGTDLDEVLDEIAEAINDAGEGGYAPPAGGIPKTDLSSDVQTSLDKADSAYQKPASGIPASDIADGVIPDVSGLATKTELQQGLAAKVDKVTGYGLSKNDYTDADKAAVGTIGSKANDDVVVKSISVNGQNPQTPTQGNVNINVQGVKGDDGITPYIGSNGHWWTGPETDSENDTGVTAQGPAGTSYTSADLVIGNALNGQGDVLGMSGAMRIKSNLDFVYSKLQALLDALGNIAFWEGKPANLLPQSLDWSVPQITVTLDKTNVSANAMITDDSDQEITGTSVLVDEGSGLTLKIKPRANNAITAASATIGGVSQTLTEDNGVYTLEIDSVTSAITIVLSVSAAAACLISYGTMIGCSATGPSSVISGGNASITFSVNSGYELNENGIVITGSYSTKTYSNGVLTITNVISDLNIAASAVEIGLRFLRGWYLTYRSWYNGSDVTLINNNVQSNGNNVIKASQIALSDYIHIPDTTLKEFYFDCGFARGAGEPSPCGACMFVKEGDDYRLIGSWSWDGSRTYRTVTPSNVSSDGLDDEFGDALAAGNLYVRFAFALTAEGGNTLMSSCKFVWGGTNGVGGTTLFSASDAYTVYSDPSLFEPFLQPQ